MTTKPPNAGKGRPKGVPNKATTNARLAIASLVEENMPKLQSLLNRIEAEEGPRAAWDCFMDVVEYHIPKLARVEHAGDDGGPLQVQIVQYSPPAK